MPRAKRSAETAAEMRDALIAAARDMIAEEGLPSVTARALAQRLGWAVGTIYTVVPTLDEVTLEANAYELDALGHALDAWRERHPDAGPRATILGFAEVYVRFTAERPRSWAAIFDRSAESDPPDWYRARTDALFRRLEAAFRPITGSDAEAARAARAIWAALQGLLSLSMAGHVQRVGEARVAGRPDIATAAIESEDAHGLALFLVDTFLRGLSAAPRG